MRNLEEEDRMWQAKDRRREKEQLQDEQEAEADGAKTAYGTVDDAYSGFANNTSNVAKRPPDFY